MAIKKPVTKSDLTKPAPEQPSGYAVVESPTGAVTTVPEVLVEGLVESGYKVK